MVQPPMVPPTMGPKLCFFSPDAPVLPDAPALELAVGLLTASWLAVTVTVSVNPKLRGTVIVKPEAVQPCCDRIVEP